MRIARPLSPLPLVLAVALLAAGCGTGERSYGGKSSTEPPGTTSSAAPPPRADGAPPGASARSCAGGTAGVRELRVTGLSCRTGQGVAAAWERAAECSTPSGASRHGCTAGGFRCLSASTDSGIAVSCSRPGRSLSFIAG